MGDHVEGSAGNSAGGISSCTMCPPCPRVQRRRRTSLPWNGSFTLLQVQKVQCPRLQRQQPFRAPKAMGIAGPGAAIENEKNSKKNQPHIVVVLFDDLGYHDLGEFSDTKDTCAIPRS